MKCRRARKKGGQQRGRETGLRKEQHVVRIEVPVVPHIRWENRVYGRMCIALGRGRGRNRILRLVLGSFAVGRVEVDVGRVEESG